ncbi:MAG TPA: copper resistance protein CopC [Streptosporangiaceae bacterium]|nr:copper resistance protein CopC [Streptosporangiaceae bacterium]
MTTRAIPASPPTRPGLRILARVLVLLATVLVPSTVLIQAAGAHAVLVSSSPVDGARVDRGPAQVRLTFDEEVGLIPGAEQVISNTGLRAGTGHISQAGGGRTIVLPLKPHLPHGTYSATWRVVSADTHVVSGSITFGIGVTPGAGTAAPPDHTRPLDVTADAAQGLVYAGVVLLAGVLAVARLLWPWALTRRRVSRLAWTGWAALLAGSAAAFLLQGPRADNQGWGAVPRLHGAGVTLTSTFGQELLARAGLLILIVPLLTRRARPGLRRPVEDAIRGLAGVALLVAVAVTGHEAVGPGVALALPAAVLHLAAMAVWLGGLVLLGLVVLPALKAGRSTLAEARLPRWSVTAYCCVVVLAITGEYMASRQISPLAALWSTRYGVLLLIKTALVAVMLITAYLAQRLLAPPPAEPETPAPETPAVIRAVRRSVRIETAIAALVVAVTAVLVSEPPASGSYGPAVTVAAPLGPDHVSVHISPTRRGPQSITIEVLNQSGAPVAASSVTASLSSPQVSALNLTLGQRTRNGSEWASRAAVAPLPGVWTLTINVSLGAAEAYTTSVRYQVW